MMSAGQHPAGRRNVAGKRGAKPKVKPAAADPQVAELTWAQLKDVGEYIEWLAGKVKRGGTRQQASSGRWFANPDVQTLSDARSLYRQLLRDLRDTGQAQSGGGSEILRLVADWKENG